MCDFHIVNPLLQHLYQTSFSLFFLSYEVATQVEALVTKHYDDQVTEMVSNNPKLDEKLIEVIKKFRDDEQSHHDIGLAHGAEEAPGYNFLTAVIGFGCRNAIWISERI